MSGYRKEMDESLERRQDVVLGGGSSHLVVFDLCNTLYYSNTTFDFIEYVLSQNDFSLKFRVFHSIYNKYSPIGILLLMIEKFWIKNLIRNLSVRLLSGFSRDELYLNSERFLKEFLSHREIHEIHGMLRKAQDSEANVYLISDSLEPVVRAVARELGVPYIAIEMQFYDGYSTGRLEKVKQKLDWVSEINYEKLTVISDNKTDRELLEEADSGYAVIHDEQDNRFWNRFPNIIPILV
jgi:phosphoserine phosphatase|tara:strand:- start:1531 stop:2244 length:714 start_codon:yes stop_codon:yes gene_type:complete